MLKKEWVMPSLTPRTVALSRRTTGEAVRSEMLDAEIGEDRAANSAAQRVNARMVLHGMATIREAAQIITAR